MSNALGNQEELTKKVVRYEKALEEITRQYDNTSVNTAKEIANEALGELSDERRRKIQGNSWITPPDTVTEKTRLEVLLSVLGKSGATIVVTRNNLNFGEEVNVNSTEFIVVEDGNEKYYDVLKEEEVDGRLEDLINECFSEEELEETYGRDQEGKIDLSTADIETYLELVGESGIYSIYTPIG